MKTLYFSSKLHVKILQQYTSGFEYKNGHFNGNRTKTDVLQKEVKYSLYNLNLIKAPTGRKFKVFKLIFLKLFSQLGKSEVKWIV